VTAFRNNNLMIQGDQNCTLFNISYRCNRSRESKADFTRMFREPKRI